jgi:ABC-type antimicrobial peptide transport system permease subunit
VGPLVIGTAAGLAAAAVGTSSMRTLLFGVQPLDAGSYAAGAALVAAAVAGACALPALRAASTHPADALRT